MRSRPVAELPVAVVAPAERLTGHRRPTRVRAERPDTRKGVSTGHLHRLTAIRRSPVAKLTVRVPSPAPRLTIARHRARVYCTRRDRHELLVRSHPYRRRAR